MLEDESRLPGHLSRSTRAEKHSIMDLVEVSTGWADLCTLLRVCWSSGLSLIPSSCCLLFSLLPWCEAPVPHPNTPLPYLLAV